MRERLQQNWTETEREEEMTKRRQNYIIQENDVLFSNDTGILGKRNSRLLVRTLYH